MTPVELVLSKLPDARRTGKGWSARCPAHVDRNPSLSICEGQNGRALVKCHAGCKFDAICAKIGLRTADLMPTGDRAAGPNKSKRQLAILAQYDYRDDVGNLLFQVLRLDPKGFRQRKPKPAGGWEWRSKGSRVVPYRLPELLADPSRPVFIVEGEKDADALAAIGLVVTCNAGGAGKWTAEHSAFLPDRRVIVLPDNDDAGHKHAEQVAQSLQGIAESVQILQLPGLPNKGDVSDWIMVQSTGREAAQIREALERLAAAAPHWTPVAAFEPGPILTCFADLKPQAVSWLWPERIPLGRITLLVGRPGEGKSFLTTDAAARVTTGTPWPDGRRCPQGSVIFISAEDDPTDTIRPRLDAHNADVRRVHLLSAVRRVDDRGPYERLLALDDLDAIELSLLKLPDCKLIIVDPIGSFLGKRIDAHRDNEVRGVLAPIAKLAEKYGPAVLLVAHRRKSSGNVADDLALGSRAFTAIARAVFHVTPDSQNRKRRLLLPGKSNLAREGTGLAFTIVGEPARISWEHNPVAMNADDALAAEIQKHGGKPGPEAVALEGAASWLRTELTRRPRLVNELYDEWCNGHGGSKRTLQRAKQSLAVHAYRHKVPGPWWWCLRTEDATPIEKTLSGDLGYLAGNAANLSVFDGSDP